MSSTIASIILRKLSTCSSVRLLKFSLSSLLTPSTREAISAPNFAAISCLAVGVSSITSCISAAARLW